MKTNTFFKTLSAAALAIVLAACGGQKDSAPAASAASSADNGAEKKEIVFGTTVGDFGDMVKDQIQPALEKKGYKVKLIEFTDYVRPNLALAEGELDINIFQHKPYLDDFKKEHKLDITEAFQVPTAPLGLYPGKLKSLDELKDGVSVSAPNDPSNFARALVMLNELGWIKLKADVDPLTASKADIAENPKNIQITELEAAQIPRSIQDLDAAVINANYALPAGLNPTKDGLFVEKADSPYANLLSVNPGDENKPAIQKLAKALQSPEVKKFIEEHYKGAIIPAF